MTAILASLFDCLQPLLECIDRDPAHCRRPRATPTLPQHNDRERRLARRREVRAQRRIYEYDHTYVPGVAMVRSVPAREYPSLDWLLLVLRQGLLVVDNVLALLADSRSYGETPAIDVNPDVPLESEQVSASYDQLRALRNRHARLIERRARRAAPPRLGPTSASRSQEEPTAPDTAVFGGDGDHLLWRDGLDLPRMCTCGSSVSPCGESTRLDALLDPCTACIKCEAKALVDELETLARGVLESILRRDGLFGRARSIADYNHQFQAIPLPALAQRSGGGYAFEDDRVFGWRQLAGQNPMMVSLVRSVAELRAKMPITPSQFKKVMGETTLGEAISAKRLFIVDYGFAAGIEDGSDHPRFAGRKYIASPVGLFALDAAGTLVPVAIRCSQSGDDDPIFTPTDGNWQIAKAVFNNAEGNNSEFVQHLGYAHLLIEAIAIAAARTLPIEHPISVLLTPHMDGTIFANNMAQSGMNEPPDMNAVGAEISASIADTLGWTADAVSAVDVRQWALPKHFERNGTLDRDVLPHYPYRDDSLRIWDAIYAWVDAYVRIYYRSDTDVVDDDELQSFAAECEAHDGGRLRGIGDGARFDTIEGLVDTLAVIVYQSSAHHALTNFPLQDIELYTPALPLAIYRPPPVASSGDDLMDYLPPLEISIIQLLLYFVIGTVHYTQLGRYPDGWFVDPLVRSPLTEFQRRLTEIEVEIRAENRQREMPYVYLLPSRIPQSINN
jgi:arachidonate 15-lipoxygenase